MRNPLNIHPSDNIGKRVIASGVAGILMVVLAPAVVAVPLSAQPSPAPAAAAPRPSSAENQAATTDRPSLVVGIVVDGLSLDQIELLRGYFGEGGFNRLLNKGVTFTDIDYGLPVDAGTATAMLLTGTAPSVNGLGAMTRFDRQTKRPQSVFLDPETMGNFTTETLSPRALTVSTLADEVRIDGDGPGLVYAIAPDAPRALILGGHAGNSAVWVNDADGKWASTTFYKELPTAVRDANLRSPIASRLDTLKWQPTMAIDRFPAVPSHRKLYPFSHQFSHGSLDRYRAYKNSPIVNGDVTALASDYITQMQLGSRPTTDMLSLAYTLEPYTYGRDPDTRVELMDSYLRLDRDLARLFETIDKRGPGLDKTVVFLAGTPLNRRQRRDNDRWNIPTGEFSSRKAVSLLNMYLMAIHGNGEWVSGYHNGSLYLNDKLIKERDLNLEEMRREAAAFLTRMAGVKEAWSIDDIMGQKASEQPDRLRRTVAPATTGDVIVYIQPGWEEIEDDNALLKGDIQTVSRAVLSTAPGFILAPGVQPQTIGSPVDARVVAPTVASLLRIRAPNAAAHPALRLK